MQVRAIYPARNGMGRRQPILVALLPLIAPPLFPHEHPKPLNAFLSGQTLHGPTPNIAVTIVCPLS